MKTQKQLEEEIKKFQNKKDKGAEIYTPNDLKFEILRALLAQKIEDKKIFMEMIDTKLQEWFNKWNRKVVTGRCLIELKEIKFEVEKI